MKVLRSIRVWLGLAFLLALPCFAGQVAVLKNGFSIQHERHQVVGDTTRLYLSADGASFVDVPTADIEHFEQAADPVTPGAQSPLANKLSSTLKTPPSPAAYVDLNEVVNAAGQRYRLDPDFINSVIKAESGFNVRAVSPKGAQGLMQLMPGTASQLGVMNTFDPRANVDGGAKYLRELLERYNFDVVKALAAYNAGPQRVEQYGGVPPYYETKAYVARVVKDFNKKKVSQQKSAKTAIAKKPPSNTPKKSSTSASKPRSTGTVAKADTARQQPQQ